MKTIDQRAALERLIRERNEDFAGLSRLLGRNPAYVQQFIKRGIPKRLAEDDRKLLARYFGVDESVLGGPQEERVRDNLIPIPRLDVDASAGPGGLGEGESPLTHIAFDKNWLRRLCAARVEDLSIIRVHGDSMAPTLNDGDEIMVDTSDAADRLRDGIYVLRRDDALVVKRLSMNPATRRITVQSDNIAYPAWHDCRLNDLTLVGRVTWAGRKIN